MQLHDLRSGKDFSEKKRIGRGGKRGTTSGRGQKGQKSRSGHRMRPAIRDLIIRTPKLRGYQNKSIMPLRRAVNVGDLEKLVSGDLINRKTLGFNFKILGGGEVKKAFTVEGVKMSKSAKVKIEKAGGKITFTDKAKPVKNKRRNK
ncbi:MAG: uL15 family ribosomal protein [bacterium]|nr:uL15 family ribosomal protein [bacterium]